MQTERTRRFKKRKVKLPQPCTVVTNHKSIKICCQVLGDTGLRGVFLAALSSVLCQMYSDTCNLELINVEIVPPSLHDKPVLVKFSPRTVAKIRLDRQADTERKATVNARLTKQKEKSFLRTQQHQAIAEEALLQTGPCLHRCHNVNC